MDALTERWVAILGGNYEVSDAGRVRRSKPGKRTRPGRVMKLILMKIGYYKVAPTVDGKNVHLYVHKIVAEAFLGPCPDGSEVNHRNGIKTDNRIENLEYVSHAENMSHASRAGLLAIGESHPIARFTESDVRAIRRRHAHGESICALARENRASTCTIHSIVHRKTWRHVR